MKISPEMLAIEAEETGFRPEMLEKVAHLLGLLEACEATHFSKKSWFSKAEQWGRS